MRLVLMLALLAPLAASAQGTGTIAGTVFEADSATAVIGANVRIDGTTLGAATDIDGNYRIIGVTVGSYTVTASYSGYQSQAVQAVDVNAGATRQLNFTLVIGHSECVILCYTPPLINNSPFASRVILGDGIDPPSRDDYCCPGGSVYAGG
ncbi:MAG TPA: carboxypeptidase-like regulatory domain-containing protein [Rubricoccaceae bacterium]|jgi:hypothetical protein